MLDRESLVIGLVVGFFIAGIAGNIFQRIRKARKTTEAPGKPMIVPTAGTPQGVINQAAAAARTCLFWTVILIVFVVVTIGGIYYLVAVLSR